MISLGAGLVFASMGVLLLVPAVLTPVEMARYSRVGLALRLERIGWSNAEFWMRLQAHYDLAQARRKASAA